LRKTAGTTLACEIGRLQQSTIKCRDLRPIGCTASQFGTNFCHPG
jgi:hypothetical protein